MQSIWLKYLEAAKGNKADIYWYALAETSGQFGLSLLADTYPCSPLFSGEEMEPVTPHLYFMDSVEDNRPLLTALIDAGIGQRQVCFFLSPLDEVSVLSHLRRYVRAANQDGEAFWLRFWDARVAPYFFSHLTTEEYNGFFSIINTLLTEDFRNPERAIIFRDSEPPALIGPFSNQWDNKGQFLLRPQLETALWDGYDDYISYQLLVRLTQQYIWNECLDMANAEVWGQRQMAYIRSRRGTEDRKTRENFLEAAWLMQCEVMDLSKYLDLPEQNKFMGTYSLSIRVLEQAQQARKQEVTHG